MTIYQVDVPGSIPGSSYPDFFLSHEGKHWTYGWDGKKQGWLEWRMEEKTWIFATQNCYPISALQFTVLTGLAFRPPE